MSSPNENLLIDIFPSSHPIWRTILEKPPAGIKYRIRKGFTGKAYLLISSLTHHKTLIHFCNGVKLAFGRKWVADMESVKVFFKSYTSMYDSDAVVAAQKRLETGECKHIMALTKAAKKTIERFLKIRSPLTVVYPSFYSEYATVNDVKKNIILFVGGSWSNKSFEAKGGVEVAEAFIKLHRSFPSYKMVMLSSPPPSLAKRLHELGIFVGFMQRSQLLREIYPNTKIILLPSMMDTVGYSVIEAMNFGAVPIVSDHFSMPEIVGDAGIILNAPVKLWREDGTPNLEFTNELSNGPFEKLVDDIIDSVHTLLDDDELYGRYSERAVIRMKSPPFSINYRNKLLKNIYETALDN